MILIFVILQIAIAIVAFIAIVYFCIALYGYSIYKERTLNHEYQKLNAKVFASTYHLFPDRYRYHRPNNDWLEYMTYTIVNPGCNTFFPIKTEYYILFNFADFCRVNRFITRHEYEKKNKQVSERETDAVLKDLHKLTTEEIEKAHQEVDNAILEMRKHMTNR